MTNFIMIPKKLLDLPHPPKELYHLGTWDDKIFENCVAVVGSRRMTEYGKQVLEKLIPALIFAKKTIVSGFMYGVDQYAHKMALENGGKTIAVLGWGINIPLEDRDRKLAKEIMDGGGLILSEWEDQKANLWTFPVRNRIVAALSLEVYVIEAGLGSGSLITARIAGELKRKVFAVPGPITSKVSAGTNLLIKQNKAEMWLGEASKQRQLDDPLLKILENEALSADEIARKLNLDVATLGAELSMLVLSGQVEERGGKFCMAG